MPIGMSHGIEEHLRLGARVIDVESVASFLLCAYRQQTVDRISPISSLTDR
jgi:hypothetical protein